MRNKFILLITTAVFMTACNAVESKTSTPSTTTASSPALSHSEAAKAILAKMTLEEKIGQVIQADISDVTPEQAKDYNLGSVLNGGNSAPGGGKVAPPQAWVDLADAYWDASTDKSDGGVGVPLLWGTDAVHGHNNLQTATIFPHNSALGATHNPSLIRKIGDVTAREIRATGLDWTFAPTLAVARDDRWGRAYESYSENPELVAKYSKAMVEGLQGIKGEDDFLIGNNVMATAKHFVGDGGTQFGIDKGDALGDVDAILDMHGAGYGPAIEAGVLSVMASFSSVNGEKMHGSKTLLTDTLRGKMGFKGFVVGDWNGHAEVPGCTATDCPEALEAGIDMYMAPDSWEGLYTSLLSQAKSGELDMNRLDEAVERILTVKFKSGLMDAGRPSSRATSDVSKLGTAENREIARQAVRESLVLLKNNDNILPLNPTSTILVTGSGANSMQQQTGGWSLNWQGDGNSNDDFKTGETVLSGLQNAMSNAGGNAVYSETGAFTEKPDVAVIVYGEQPYAEYRGDRSDLVFEFENGKNLALLNSFKDQGIPVISVFLTGRPLWVNPHLNSSDAFVVAWLPGTEAGGIADVLVADKDGAARHDFKGKLSFSWPADGSGMPINTPDTDGVLFPYGYGKTYEDAHHFALLSEDPKIANLGANFDGSILTRGDAAAAFGFFVGDSSNANTPITALRGKSLGGGISIRGTDFKAQEDARILTWSGNGFASASVKTLRDVDLSALGDMDALALEIDWRVDEAPDTQMSLSMGCGEGCGGALDVSKMLKNLPANEWTTSSISLTCFANAGLEPAKVETLLKLETESAASVAIHSAKITPSGDSAHCPSTAKKKRKN